MIAPGSAADLAILDVDRDNVINPCISFQEEIHLRRNEGKAVVTIAGGKVVYHDKIF